MPTYDYACAACGHRFEVVHGVHGTGPDECPSCGGGPVRKAFAPPTVLFKGSGWAKMDRRSTANSGKSTSDGDDKGSQPARETTETSPAAAGSSGEKSSGEKSSGGEGASSGEGASGGEKSSRDKSSGGEKRSTAAPAD